MRESLDGRHFDIVVIGGGINGVAIARECALADKIVLLVEQHDFASGTTSRATRIIHGGLRYLEHGEISLVRESLRERERLVHEKAHLVRPLNFLLALPPDGHRGALELRFGLWLYRRFAGRPPVLAATNDRRALESLLDAGQPWNVFAYEDAQCEFPERLVAEWLREAEHSGATCLNHCEVLSVERSGGHVSGVRLRDRFTNQEPTVYCDSVINATGPWADAICTCSNITLGEPMIGGVRGAHILLPTFNGAPKSAVYTEAIDGRPIFVIPWAEQLLVGTTETKDAGDPARVQASPDEIRYLMQSFQRLFPSVPLASGDIRAAFAGVRPLPYVSDRTPASITRSHILVDHTDDGASGLVSVIGGKLTTAASLAREAARVVGIDVPEPRGYAVRDLVAANHVLNEFERSIAKQAKLSRQTSSAIVRWFGSSSPDIAKLAASNEALRQPITSDTPHILAEAVFAAHHEHAVTLADILLRRLPIALFPNWTGNSVSTAAQRIGHALHWDSRKINEERDAFAAEYASFLTKPTS